jgi:hypothetical protein
MLKEHIRLILDGDRELREMSIVLVGKMLLEAGQHRAWLGKYLESAVLHEHSNSGFAREMLVWAFEPAGKKIDVAGDGRWIQRHVMLRSQSCFETVSPERQV